MMQPTPLRLTLHSHDMAPRLPPPPMTAIPKETSADMSDNTTPLPSPTSTICVLDVEKGQEPLDVGPPPDGGAAAWLCVFSTFLVLFCIHGFGEQSINCPNVLF